MYYQDTLFKILAFLQCCLLITAQQNVTCFYPNGTDLSPKTDVYDFFQQCPTSLNNDDVYMCCKKSDPFDDVCQPNGLCARSSNRPLGLVQGLLRIGCTDPSYTSPSCLKLCDTGIGKQYPTLRSHGNRGPRPVVVRNRRITSANLCSYINRL